MEPTKMKWFEGNAVPHDVWRNLEADNEALYEEVETDINDQVTDEQLYGPDDYIDFDDYWGNNFNDYCSIPYKVTLFENVAPGLNLLDTCSCALQYRVRSYTLPYTDLKF